MVDYITVMEGNIKLMVVNKPVVNIVVFAMASTIS